MREFYNISEIAQLYDLCPDTLRYYEEKGLLHPVRGENRYRMYGIQDICTLNIIRSLRHLGMPVERIGSYLTRRSLDSTLDLIQEEENILTRQMERLKALRQEVSERRKRIETCQNQPVGKVVLRDLPQRPYVALREDIILEGEIDFLLKKLEKEYQRFIRIIGNQPVGAVLDEKSLAQGVYNHYASVFFLTKPHQPENGALPKGRYACLFYPGAYSGFRTHLLRLEEFVAGQGLRPVEAPVEFYHIDAHDTNREEEYLTEIQLRVEQNPDAPM